jgi:hypothetical protein
MLRREQLRPRIPEGQKKWQTVNFCSMNELSCQDAELKVKKYGEKTSKNGWKLGCENMQWQKLCEHIWYYLLHQPITYF